MKISWPFNILENENDCKRDTSDREIIEIVLIDFKIYLTVFLYIPGKSYTLCSKSGYVAELECFV